MSSYGTSTNDVRLSIGNIGSNTKPNGTRMNAMSTNTGTGSAGYAYYNSESGPKALLTIKGTYNIYCITIIFHMDFYYIIVMHYEIQYYYST